MIGHADGNAEVQVAVDYEPPIITKLIAQRAEERKQDEPISLNLKDADIRDVLSVFSKLTSVKIVVDDDVSGLVTISVHDVPWKEVFARILDDANLRQEHVGDTIHVHRK
jgi:type IV pilus assembly protein PilQ